MKGVTSFKSSYTPFKASCPYTAPNAKITSSSDSFKTGSSNNDESDISASREGGDIGFSIGEGALEDATTFPFPFTSTTTPRGLVGGGGGGGGGGEGTRES